MLYVERDEKKSIIAIHTSPQPQANEQKSIMDEEILAFLDNSLDTQPWTHLLSITDIGVIRVLEDLIDVLVSKNVIMITDLPEGARQKILERKTARQKIDNPGIMVEDII